MEVRQGARALVEEGTNIVGYTLIHGQQFFLGFPRDDPAQFKVQAEQAIRSLVFPKSPADDLEWPIRSP